jgi:uncharacterized membrane protein
LESEKPRKPSYWQQAKGVFQTYFVSGLLVLVPILITIWVLRFIIQTMDNIFLPMVLKALLPGVDLPSHYYGLGAVFTVAIVILVGAIARSFVAGRVVALGESLIARIPLVRVVYGALKQLMETVLRKEHKEFRGVALVPFPHPEVYSVGFVTGLSSGEVQTKTQEKVINVFIPTTPNPTTGFYIMVPSEKAILLDMTVEEAFKMVMSAGIVSPPQRGSAAAANAQPGTVATPGEAAPGEAAAGKAAGQPSRARG